MVNASFVFWPAKYVRNIMSEKQLIYLDWWNYYKEGDRKFLRGEEIKQKSLHDHILEVDPHSFEEDISICLIDITDTSDPHKREH